MMDLFQFFQFS